MVSRVSGELSSRWDYPQDAWDLPIEVGVEDDRPSVEEKDLSHQRHVETEKPEPVSGELITALRVAEFINSF